MPKRVFSPLSFIPFEPGSVFLGMLRATGVAGLLCTLP